MLAMAAPSTASQAVSATHPSIDETSEPRRVPPEIFLTILDELIAIFEASFKPASWILGGGEPPNMVTSSRHAGETQSCRLEGFASIALISKDAHAYARRNFGFRVSCLVLFGLPTKKTMMVLTLPRIDKFSTANSLFNHTRLGHAWTPSLQYRTSFLRRIKTLKISCILTPNEFMRVLSDFPNVELIAIFDARRGGTTPAGGGDQERLCTHGKLLPVNEDFLPILREGNPDRQSIQKALDRGARVIIARYIGYTSVEVFSTPKGLRVKFSNTKCDCDPKLRHELRRNNLLYWFS